MWRAKQFRVGLMCVAAACLIGLAVPWLRGLDEAVHARLDQPAPRWAFALDSFQGWPGLVLLAVVCAVPFLGRRSSVRSAGWLAAASAVSTLVALGLSTGLKGLFGRLRPEGGEVLLTSGSFPSGHATGAGVFVVCVGMLLAAGAHQHLWQRLWWVLGGALLAAMMASRLLLGVHWLSDTVGGALLGVGVALCCWSVARTPDGSRASQQRRQHVKKPAGSGDPDAATD